MFAVKDYEKLARIAGRVTGYEKPWPVAFVAFMLRHVVPKPQRLATCLWYGLDPADYGIDEQAAAALRNKGWRYAKAVWATEQNMATNWRVIERRWGLLV